MGSPCALCPLARPVPRGVDLYFWSEEWAFTHPCQSGSFHFWCDAKRPVTALFASASTARPCLGRDQSSGHTGWHGAICFCRRCNCVLAKLIAWFEGLRNERNIGVASGCFGIAFSQSTEIWNALRGRLRRHCLSWLTGGNASLTSKSRPKLR